jgi:hypothetical protein
VAAAIVRIDKPAECAEAIAQMRSQAFFSQNQMLGRFRRFHADEFSGKSLKLSSKLDSL